MRAHGGRILHGLLIESRRTRRHGLHFGHKHAAPRRIGWRVGEEGLESRLGFLQLALLFQRQRIIKARLGQFGVECQRLQDYAVGLAAHHTLIGHRQGLAIIREAGSCRRGQPYNIALRLGHIGPAHRFAIGRQHDFPAFDVVRRLRQVLLNPGDQSVIVTILGRSLQSCRKRHIGQQGAAGLEIERQRHGRNDESGQQRHRRRPQRPPGLGRRGCRNQPAGNFVARGFSLRRRDQATIDVAVEFGQLIAEDGAVIGVAVHAIRCGGTSDGWAQEARDHRRCHYRKNDPNHANL